MILGLMAISSVAQEIKDTKKTIAKKLLSGGHLIRILGGMFLMKLDKKKVLSMAISNMSPAL